MLGVAAIAFLATREPEVVIPTKTPAQIAEEKRRKEEAEANAFNSFTAGAKSEYLTLKAAEAGGNLRFADNAFDPKWPGFVSDYRKLADRITADEKYGTRPEVVEIAEMAKSDAANIERYVKLRTETRKVIEESRRTAVTELEGALSKQRTAFDEAVEAKAWVKAAAAADPEAINKFVRPLADQKVKDILPGQVPAETKKMFEEDLLLDPEQHVQPLLEKYAPGDPPGQALLDQVLKQARGIHTRALADGREPGGPGNPRGARAGHRSARRVPGEPPGSGGARHGDHRPGDRPLPVRERGRADGAQGTERGPRLQ